MESKKVLLLIAILIFSLYSPLISVQGQEPEYFLRGFINGRDVIFNGEYVTISHYTNSSVVLAQIFNPYDALAYEDYVSANQSFIYYPAIYGEYKVKLSIGELNFNFKFWFQDTRNLYTIAKPYSWIFKNIQYTFLDNYTLLAVKEGKGFLIDWLSEIFIKLKPVATIYKNDYGLLKIHLDGKNIKCDNWLIDTCFGLKIRSNGTLSSPTTLKWNYKSFNGLLLYDLNSFYIKLNGGNLVLDYEDFNSRSTGLNYALDKTNLKINVYLSTVFDIDPTIYENGFEEGDLTGWDASSGTPTVISDPVHHGSYSMSADCDNAEYVEETLGSSYGNLWCRFYFRFTSLPTGDQYAYLFGLYHTDGGLRFMLRYRSQGGVLRFVSRDGNYHDHMFDYTLTINTWYCIEVEYDTTSNENNIYLDGDLLYTHDSAYGYPSTVIRLGTILIGGSWTGDYIFDCFVADDEYIGEEASGGEYSRSVSQTLSFSFSASRLIELTRGITDALTFNFSTSRLIEVSKTVTQSFNLIFSTNRIIEVTRPVSGILTFAFSSVASFGLWAYTSLTFTLSETANRLIEASRPVTEVLGLNFIANRIIEITRSVSETLTFTFNIEGFLANIYNRSVSLTFNLIESTSEFFIYSDIATKTYVVAVGFIFTIIILCYIIVYRD